MLSLCSYVYNPQPKCLALIGNNYHNCSSILIIASNRYITLHLYIRVNKGLFHPHSTRVSGSVKGHTPLMRQVVPIQKSTGCGAGYIGAPASLQDKQENEGVNPESA